MCAVIFPGKSLLGRYLLNRINNNQQLPCTALLFAFWSEGFLSHALLGSLHYCDGRYNTPTQYLHTPNSHFFGTNKRSTTKRDISKVLSFAECATVFHKHKIIVCYRIKSFCAVICLTGFQAARSTLFSTFWCSFTPPPLLKNEIPIPILFMQKSNSWEMWSSTFSGGNMRKM